MQSEKPVYTVRETVFGLCEQQLTANLIVACIFVASVFVLWLQCNL